MANTLDQARNTLIRGADLVDLAEAIGTIIRDASSSLDDLRLGLRHSGLVAEQAELELRRRQGATNAATTSGAVILPSGESRPKSAAETR